MSKILIVDDEEKIRRNFSEILNIEGFTTIEASNGPSALESVRKEDPSTILLDLNMPGMNGLEVLRELGKIDQNIPVIIVTAHGDIPSAVEAMKDGAYDFIMKPPDIERLILIIKKAIEKCSMAKKVQELYRAFHSSLQVTLGKSNAIREIIEQLQPIATSDYSVIIQGETGTGKTFLANVIHNLSKRANMPFVKVSIGSIPETLVESELFGHEKGAFTGAGRTKKGYFEAAEGGTLFIDDMDNISPFVQGKMLSVIEDKKIYHLGSTKPLDVDIRIISASNKDIKNFVQNGKFRDDLFFRLSEFIIILPPLRERSEDILSFSKKFLAEVSSELGKSVRKIQDEAMEILVKYSWPGNLRELRNVIKKAVLFADAGFIRPEHVRFILQNDSKEADNNVHTVLPLKQAAKEAERKAIINALELTGGNKTKAAKLLNITYRSLLFKIKEFGV